ncbi:MAG: hypothetical protein ABI634_12255 [Acidobacteriota bacterium]
MPLTFEPWPQFEITDRPTGWAIDLWRVNGLPPPQVGYINRSDDGHYWQVYHPLADVARFKWVGPFETAVMAFDDLRQRLESPSSPRGIAACPNCDAEAPRRLAEVRAAFVTYYRCSVCGHIWTTPKNVDGPIQHVTPLTRR